ncbi:MAG TPA: hypothetical protein VGH99_18735 [Pseudonocardia sp.]|jgi:hypothetical protein
MSLPVRTLSVAFTTAAAAAAIAGLMSPAPSTAAPAAAGAVLADHHHDHHWWNDGDEINRGDHSRYDHNNSGNGDDGLLVLHDLL